MRSHFLVAILFLFQLPATHAEEPDKAEVKRLAEKIAKATRENDAETIVDYTYPGLVEFAGGRKAMIEITRQSLKLVKDDGAAIEKFEVEEPDEFYVEGKNTFAIARTELAMTVQGKTIGGKSFLLAISPDAGKTWTFLDGNGFQDKKLMNKILPKLPEKLVLPDPPEFKVIEEQ